MENSSVKSDNEFEPYVPSEKDLKYIVDWYSFFPKTEKTKAKLRRRIRALKRGEYYDAIQVAHKMGCENLRAGIIFRTLVVSKQIKRIEFICLRAIVHKSELPVFVGVVQGYMKLKRSLMHVFKSDFLTK